MNIIEALKDDQLLRHCLKGESLTSWMAWFSFLKMATGMPLDSEDREIIYKCMGIEKRIKIPEMMAKQIFCISSRRSGKSTIAVVLAIYLACLKDWRGSLSRGEKGYILLISYSKNQARILMDYCEAFLLDSPVLKNEIERIYRWEIWLKSGIRIKILPGNYRAVRGYTILSAIVDEIAFLRQEDSANPDRELILALLPGLGTIRESMLICISSPYMKKGVLFDAHKKHYGKLGDPLVWASDTLTMNPSFDRRVIDRHLEEDPEGAGSEWLGNFRSDLSNFLSPEIVEGAVGDRHEIDKMDGMEYVGFCDPSGGKVDSMVLAVAHKEEDSGKVILDLIREIRSPFVPQSVVEEFSGILKSYKISKVIGDRYSGEWVISSFREYGIEYINSDLTKAQIYLNFQPIINSGKVILLKNDRLIVQLKNLVRKTRAGSSDSVDHGIGSHDDVANASGGAVVYANRGREKAFFKIGDVPLYGAGSKGFDPFDPFRMFE